MLSTPTPPPRRRRRPPAQKVSVSQHYLPDGVANLNGGEVIHIRDRHILVLGEVARFVVPRDLCGRLAVHWQLFKLQHLPCSSPDLVFVEIVPVDDGRD
jgi:hypothetical protein